MGFDVHGLCNTITTHSEEEQRDMDHSGSTYQDGSLHSHEKHMDIGLAGPSLSGGDSLVAWCVELYSVRLGYSIPIWILAKAARGIRDTIAL